MTEEAEEMEEVPREDQECWCPRVNLTVWLVSGVCFSRKRGSHCTGCAFHLHHIEVRIFWLLLEMLQRP